VKKEQNYQGQSGQIGKAGENKQPDYVNKQ
jgi:hypothetical protein